MNTSFVCSECNQTTRAEVPDRGGAVECSQCAGRWEIPAGAFDDGRLERCLVCPSTELFVRKDFPQGIGVTIVVIGFAASCVTWYFHMVYATFGVLFLTALLDVLLYALVGNVLECYRCQAQYRGLAGLDRYAPFNLETYERYRQQAARLAEPPGVSQPSSGKT